MIKNVRFVVFSALFAVCACLLGACSQNGAQDSLVLFEGEQEERQEDVEVSFFGYKADAANLISIESALHGFMEEYPDITVTYEGMKGTSYWEVFERRVESGYIDDLVMVDHDHVLSLGAGGTLADLSGLPTIDNFSEVARSQFINSDGSAYFVPICISAYGLFVNEDLLEKHGQKVPTNLEEFGAVCGYFADQGITPIVANNYNSLRSVIVARGMYDVYRSGDSAAFIERCNSGGEDLAGTLRPGVELVAEMIREGWVDTAEVLATEQTSDDLALFAAGDRPFMITGGWASTRLKDMELNFAYNVYPYPIMEEGSVLVTDVNTCISVYADGPHAAEAMLLIEYLTRPEVMWDYCDSQSSYSPMEGEQVPSDEAVAPTVAYVADGPSVVGSDYRLTLPLDASLGACVNEMLGGMGADEAVRMLSGLLAQ